MKIQIIDQLLNVIRMALHIVTMKWFRRITKSTAVKCHDPVILRQSRYILLVKFCCAHMSRHQKDRILSFSTILIIQIGSVARFQITRCQRTHSLH